MNFNNNTKNQNQKTSNMINNLGNILSNNNLNNKNEIQSNKFEPLKINNNQNDFNRKMLSTNSSINFQSDISINPNVSTNKENFNPQYQQSDNNQFQKLMKRNSFDLNSFNENINYSLLRANSCLEQNKFHNRNPLYKQIENERLDLSQRSNSEFLNNNNNNNNQPFTNNNLNMNLSQEDNDANLLFNELNMMYANNTHTQNSSSYLASERDEKELNRLKENYYNVSNKLKAEQNRFNKEGNNSLVGMLQLLKMVKIK